MQSLYETISVVLITYGHEKFIEECINGVLMQNCTFSIDLIIANDCSPDKTHEIIGSIINNHPRGSWIRYFKHEKNIGMMPNFLFGLNAAKGKYVALCEGDDFWTDPMKLQKQIDFMESHQNFSMCFHAVEIERASETDFYEYPIPPLDVLFLRDVIRTHYVPTCSLVFRNSYFPLGYPSWFTKSISGDIPLEILVASKGEIKYFEQKMACYRRNLGSITHDKDHISRIRPGYIYMYSKIAHEIQGGSKIYLYGKVLKLRLGYIKDFLRKLGLIKK